MNDDFEELESLEEIDVDDEPRQDEECFDRKELLNHPIVLPLTKTMKNYSFPSALLNSRLYIIYENDQYFQLFRTPERQLPRSFAQDFPHDLSTDKIGTIYTSLHSKTEGYSFRGRLQAVHRNMLNQIFNVNISPIFSDKCETPIVYQAFLDNVTLEQNNLLHNTFLSLLEASKLKDNDTGNHIQRVGEYSKILSQYLFEHKLSSKITPEFIHNIHFLAQMHDVGKIGTPDDILNKEGSLEDHEWEIMREHTINGAYIMSTYPHPMAREIALFHHEHWDGNGYPYKLAGDMIPLSSRIVSIADVYDALRMKRSYKAPFDHQKASEIILEQRGTHFDPHLINAFLEVHQQFDDLYEELKD